eukprot:4030599-Amphidinium_carterae.1
MSLQEWYDDDNMDYDANELKTAIKDEHDSLQKTNVFTRVHARDYCTSTTIEGHDADKVGDTLTTWRYEEETQSTIRSKRIHAE